MGGGVGGVVEEEGLRCEGWKDAVGCAVVDGEGAGDGDGESVEGFGAHGSCIVGVGLRGRAGSALAEMEWGGGRVR